MNPSGGPGVSSGGIQLSFSGGATSGNSSMINSPGGIQSYDNNNVNTSGMGTPSSNPNDLASFVGGGSSLSNPNVSGMNLTPLSGHQRMGSSNGGHSLSNGLPASAGGPLSSFSAVMSSAQSHVPAPAPGQSETSA